MKYYAIHVSGEESRKKNIQKLSDTLGAPIELQKSEMPTEVSKRTLSCTRNHIEALTKFLDTDEPEAIIFEDDAEIKDYEGFRNYYLDAPSGYDILYFGAKEYVRHGEESGKYLKIYRSWGVHAYLVTRFAAVCIINEYNAIIACNPSEKIETLPPDWLINYSIIDFDLNAYGPVNPMEHVVQGNFPSLVTPK